MIILRQKAYSNFKPNPDYIKKEREMWAKGYGVLPKKDLEGRKKDFVYFTDGDEIVGYNLWTAEEHRLREKKKAAKPAKSQKSYSALDSLEQSQNKVYDARININKKVFGNSKLGRISRNNLEAERTRRTTGTKNLKILVGKE